MNKQILVLGGGIGGIKTAKALSQKIGNEDGINLARILVFEKEEKHTYNPSLPWLMVGKRKPGQLYRDTRKIEMGGIKVIFGDIEKVDPSQISVSANGKEYKGDYMVVSLGIEQSTEHSLDRSGHNFYTIEGASAFHEQLKSFNGGKIAVVVPSLPVKSPVAPYEAVMLVEEYIREKRLSDKTEISLITPESAPMDFAGNEVSNNVKQLMESKGINYLPEHQLISATDKTMTFKTGEHKSKTVDFDLLAYTPKHQCPSVLHNTGLVGESGWIEVNRQSLETNFTDVYAIGDVTSVPIEGGNKTLPKAGVIAKNQAKIVAHNIARKIAGKSGNKDFKGRGNYILELGNNKAGYVSGDFYSSDININKPSLMRHWQKVLSEKSWFIKNF